MSAHTFHVPVMGTGFTADTPLRIARYGIASVISLVDDQLLEDLRRAYSGEYNCAYVPILKYDEDWRARRITAYLDLIDMVVARQIADLKRAPFTPGSDITQYFELLPDHSPVHARYQQMLSSSGSERARLEEALRAEVVPGAINVNIMTKLDRDNTDRLGLPLPEIYSDALAALRGYARSTLGRLTPSAIVFSAGLNRRLYSYAATLEDFFPGRSGRAIKEIILKVSDYRSAEIQGKFFARKGLWVAEYRIESGLNCGGHAFAGNGHLMGPVLEEFRARRAALGAELMKVCGEALAEQKKAVPENFPPFRITTQGGIGTAAEDAFLRRHYAVDSTGWGSPFLLVPEVTPVEPELLNRLVRAKEEDLFLSDVSPIGVPFYNLRNSPSEENKYKLAAEGRPGSGCPLGHLVRNTEFTDQPICTASRQYQSLKIAALKEEGLPPEVFRQRYDKVIAKACICNELGDTVYVLRGIPKKDTGVFPAVCPGPNIAYFDRVASLREMVDHIYGRGNLMRHPRRPHMFLKELMLNIDFLLRMVRERHEGVSDKKDADFDEFYKNLAGGIAYYRALAPLLAEGLAEAGASLPAGLDACQARLEEVMGDVRRMPPLVMAVKSPRLTAVVPAAAPVVPNGAELTILAASHSGNGKTFSRRMEARAAGMGFKVRRCDLALYNAKDLVREKALLVIISTHGEGAPPASAEELFQYLRSAGAPDLRGIPFAVLALGDKSYVHFCKAGRDLDALLEQRGGRRIIPRVDCDSDFTAGAGQWMKNVLRTLLPASAAGVNEASLDVNEAAPAAGYSPAAPFGAVIAARTRVSGPGSVKETYHITLNIKGSGVTYLPGDCCGITAVNSPRLVAEVLAALKASGDERLPDGKTLAELLKIREVSVLIPSVIEKHNTFARSQELAAILEDPVRLKAFMYGRDLIDLLSAYPVAYRPQDLMDVLRPAPARLYSIASSRRVDPDALDLLVGAVRYRVGTRAREGLASTFLADRVRPGETVMAYIRQNENFRLPSDPRTPVIMVGAGTGVAPFRAFVQERAAGGQPGRSWLFFGNPHRATDFTYQAQWEESVKSGVLTRLSTAFSRDQAAKDYVTHRIREEAREVAAWLDEGAFVYVSGAAALAGDVADAFAAAVGRAGMMPHDRAVSYISKLRHSGRYVEDVY